MIDMIPLSMNIHLVSETDWDRSNGRSRLIRMGSTLHWQSERSNGAVGHIPAPSPVRPDRLEWRFRLQRTFVGMIDVVLPVGDCIRPFLPAMLPSAVCHDTRPRLHHAVGHTPRPVWA